MEKFIEDYDFWKPDTSEIVQELYDCLIDRGICKEGSKNFVTQIIDAIKNEYGD